MRNIRDILSKKEDLEKKKPENKKKELFFGKDFSKDRRLSFLKIRFSSKKAQSVANLVKVKGSRGSGNRPTVGLHAYFLRPIRLKHFIGTTPRNISN